MPKTISLRDIHDLQEQAKTNLLALPGRVRLPGMGRNLNEREIVGLCYLTAALQVMGSSVDTSGLVFKMDPADSETID